MFQLDPDLRRNKLYRDSASFVDVLRTNGALKPCGQGFRLPFQYGLLERLGHLDYNINGGKSQPRTKDAIVS